MLIICLGAFLLIHCKENNPFRHVEPWGIIGICPDELNQGVKA